MRKIVWIKVMVVLLAWSFAGTGSTKGMSIDELLDKVDSLYRSKSAHARLEMEIITPHWKRLMKLEMWSQGLDKTFIRILSPKKDKGISTLRVKNDMWNYFPKIDRTIKIPPSMRMGSWMGSDFTNDDLVKETTLRMDYKSIFIDRDNKDNYVIELTPRENTVSVWERIVLFIERKGILPVRQEFYNERKELVRTMIFRDVTRMGGRTLPVTLELVSNKKKGQRTLVRYLGVEFDKGVKDSVFTRRNLQKRR